MPELAERLAGVEVRVDKLEERFELHEEKQNGAFKDIMQELKDINKKINGRPSWPVAIVITVLSSICAGLIVNTLK